MRRHPKGRRLLREVIAVSNSLTIDMTNVKKLKKDIEKRSGYAAKAANQAVADFKKRAPGWVAKGVSQHYTIKSREVKDAVSGEKKVGTIKIGGFNMDEIEITFSGRTLTLKHFQFTPRSPGTARLKTTGVVPTQVSESGYYTMAQPRKQKVTATIKKGQKRTITGKYNTSPFIASMNGSGNIPFQRRGSSRTDVETIKTLSIPQMVTSEEASKTINELVTEGVGKRLANALKRFNQ